MSGEKGGAPARKVPRSSPQAPVNSTLAPPTAAILLDFTVQEEDWFEFGPAGRKPVRVDHTSGKAFDKEHSLVQVPVTHGTGKSRYKLVHVRSGKVRSTLIEGAAFGEVAGYRERAEPQRADRTPEERVYMTRRMTVSLAKDRDLRQGFPDFDVVAGARPQKKGVIRFEDPRQDRPNDGEGKQGPAAIDLQIAYGYAMAVMTRRCRFVQWNFFVRNPMVFQPSWQPLSFKTLSRRDPYYGMWSEFEGERWIYVYRRVRKASKAPDWVEEMFVDKAGMISARAVEMGGSGKAPAPQPVGKTVCFARRLLGEPMEYFFFATQIRLPETFAEDLRKDVARFTVPVTFEPDDSGIADFLPDQCLVPVLDPLTVGQKYHRCLHEALNSCIRYTSNDPGEKDRKDERLDRRMKRRLLGQLLMIVTGGEQVHTRNRAYDKLRDGRQGIELEIFLKEFESQVTQRNNLREAWAGLLTGWLRSEPVDWIKTVYLTMGNEVFADFVRFWGNSVWGITETNAGKVYMKEVVGNDKHWAHKVLLPSKVPAQAEAAFQVLRKAKAPAMAAATELAKTYGLVSDALTAEGTLNWVGKVTQEEFEGVIFRTTKPRKIAYPTSDGRVRMTQIERIEANTTIHMPFEPADRIFHGRGRTFVDVNTSLEGINFLLAANAMVRDWEEGSTADKAFAILNTFGSGLDLAQSLLEVSKSNWQGEAAAVAMEEAKMASKLGRRLTTIGAIGFWSSALDTVLGFRDTFDAVGRGNTGTAVGSAAVAVGSGVLTFGNLYWSLMAVEAGPLGMVGLGIVALGNVIKLVAGPEDSDYEKLVGHSDWGAGATSPNERPDWATAAFKDWKGRLEVQLNAAITLLCRPEFSHEDDRRGFRLAFDWLPPGTIVDVFYEATWEDTPGWWRPLQGKFTITPDGAVGESETLKMMAVKGKGSTYVIQPKDGAKLDPIVKKDKWVFAPDGLQMLRVGVLLVIESGRYQFRYPAAKQESRKWFPLYQK